MKTTLLTFSCIFLLSACSATDTTSNVDAPENATGGYSDAGAIGTAPSGVTNA